MNMLQATGGQSASAGFTAPTVESAKRRLAFAKSMDAWESGRLSGRQFVQEAMSTDDFPNVLGDTLNREVQEAYRTWPKIWEALAAKRRAKDYRTLKSFTPNSINGRLAKVGEFGANSTTQNKADRTAVTYSVEDYEGHASLSHKVFINDDVDEFSRIPTDFAEAAVHTEGFQFSSTYVNASGPTGLTQLTSNPVFGVTGLKAAFTQILKSTDSGTGEPIMIEAPVLVIGPGLAIDAAEVIKATTIEMNTAAGTRNLFTENWVKTMIDKVVVDPYIPIIASSNEDTMWCLIAQPKLGRSAFEAAFLNGMEQPRILIKAPTAQRAGGGDPAFMDRSFEGMTVEYLVRHTLAFAKVNAQYGFMSNGSGS